MKIPLTKLWDSFSVPFFLVFQHFHTLTHTYYHLSKYLQAVMLFCCGRWSDEWLTRCREKNPTRMSSIHWNWLYNVSISSEKSNRVWLMETNPIQWTKKTNKITLFPLQSQIYFCYSRNTSGTKYAAAIRTGVRWAQTENPHHFWSNFQWFARFAITLSCLETPLASAPSFSCWFAHFQFLKSIADSVEIHRFPR